MILYAHKKRKDKCIESLCSSRNAEIVGLVHDLLMHFRRLQPFEKRYKKQGQSIYVK